MPYSNLFDKVEMTGNSGVGIIHWTTKPLDIYFKNTEQQIWKSTENESLYYTVDFMAERIVDKSNRELFSSYLKNWVEKGPKFGRETRTWFVDHEISKDHYQKIVRECKNRLNMLAKIDEKNNIHFQYFKGLEEFCIDFYQAQFHYQEALKACNAGDFENAITLISKCNPEKVIQKYAGISKISGITKGEMGVIVEMNLSWLPLINSLKQTLRQQPAYFNFGKVNFPDLGVGLLNTNYLMDAQNQLWRTFGEEETGAKFFHNDLSKISSANESLKEIVAEGIKSKNTIQFDLFPYAADISPRDLKNPDWFLPGKYEVTLIFASEEEAELNISAEGLKNKKNLYKGGILIVPGKISTRSFVIQIDSKDTLKILLTNIDENCFINGAVVKPVKR
jgi:hypothetical protein